MRLASWIRPPQHFLITFLAITLVLAGALAWFGSRLFQQDRILHTQRIQEHLERSAYLVSTGLLQTLSDTRERLTELTTLPESQLSIAAASASDQLATDGLILILNEQGLTSYPDNRLLYLPYPALTEELPEPVFLAGEILEFQQQDYSGAAGAFRELSRSEDTQIRAGALLRLGRNLRKAGRYSDALAVYDELMQLGPIPVRGLPAELVARHVRCLILDELDRIAELQNEAQTFYTGLQGGRWQITRPVYSYYSDQVQDWLGSVTAAPEEIPAAEPSSQPGQQSLLALAAGAERLWEEWQSIRSGEKTGGPGQRTLWLDNHSLHLLWQAEPQRLVAILAGPLSVERLWVSHLHTLMQEQGVRLTLADIDGREVLTQFTGEPTQHAVRTTAATKLPWTLHLSQADPRADLAELAGRRRIMLVGLVLMAALVLVGSYFIGRAMTHEMAVARLQSDFVAAVSHEFRSPLTSIRHLADMLDRGRIRSEERRTKYYRVLVRESERLHRLVENLLDFGRMESGAMEYTMQRLDAAALVFKVVREFREEVAGGGYQIELISNVPEAFVLADHEAVGRALWNLLDNAVKYSQQCKTVWVDLNREDDHLAISVRDRGPGIPLSEQKSIFDKFVRGDASRHTKTRGTGIGLAMARQIVDAHGGRIRLDSTPGSGSTFTILLPIEK